MIKRANNKKKKGFTLIELIIVLAVMAIIALIAIPNFTAVRDNSKIKADKQSCETIERTVLMLVADETVTVTAPTDIEFTVEKDGTPGKVTSPATPTNDLKDTEIEAINKALAEVNKPQENKKTIYKIAIGTDGSVEVVTGAITTTP
ncbi:type II secretion system protein [Clostridium sp.]|uniref:type II secretion system protein n=1 Tax=Clostridium sp. TaxID=1506 RepID=UPI0032179B4B